MSKQEATQRKVLRLGLTSEKGKEVLGVALLFVVAFLTASLLSFRPMDPSLLHHTADADAPVRNLVGPVGANLSALLFALMGLTCFVLPAALGALAWHWLRPSENAAEASHKMRWKVRAIGGLAVLISLPAMAQLLFADVLWRNVQLEAGGVLGVLVLGFLIDKVNAGGAFLVLSAILVIGASLAARTTLRELLAAWKRHALALWANVRVSMARHRKHHAVHESVQPQKPRSKKKRPPLDLPLDLPPGGEIVATAAAPAALRKRGKRVKQPSQAELLDLPMRVVPKSGEGRFSVRKVTVPSSLAPPDAPARPPKSAEPAPAKSRSIQAAIREREAALRAEEEEVRQKAAAQPSGPRLRKPPAQKTIDFVDDGPRSPDELPPVNLLKTAKPAAAYDEDELVASGVAIRRAASEFGVEGHIQGASPGPVITTFEFQPAPGVKVSKIVNLQDDLALTLRADSVRIDRIPGRSTLGIEVPNKTRSVIPLGGLLADPRFEEAESVLTMAIGVDLNGRPYYADLAKMPHLLVAGATGAGKSVGLQSMITSILYKATREDVQFIFIDPKRIELGVYADIPHLKTEVVCEPKKAANALRWAVAEMERRYRLLAEVHVRSIDYYNRAIRDPRERERLSLKEGEGQSEFKPEDFQPLPYYVVVIDELADLMMVASSDVEASIARLAQMARAVGIHLIVATQRPSVDVLTGTIKANFPCRLSYATATRHDSRTILDQVGSEKLLGKGDALFMPPGTSRIMRLHGAYISEEETAGLIRWLKRRGKPQLDPDVVKDPEESNGGAAGSGGADGGDALFDEAARLVVRERQASASFLQRRMRVGFSRAARLIDMLEADGILGPAQGSKSREVLVPPDFYEEIDQARSEE